MFRTCICLFVFLLLAIPLANAVSSPHRRSHDQSERQVEVTVFAYMMRENDASLIDEAQQDHWRPEYFLSLGGLWVEGNDQRHYPTHDPSGFVLAQFIHHRPMVQSGSHYPEPGRASRGKVLVDLNVVHIRWLSRTHALVQGSVGQFTQDTGFDRSLGLYIYDVVRREDGWRVTHKEIVTGFN